MYISSFNSQTLAYKLLSGKLRESRKHSEQLNKYVAGLFDSDGCICLRYSKDRKPDYYRIYLSVSIGQSASVDDDFSLLRALRDYYDLGSVTYRDVPGDMHKSLVGQWRLSYTESLIFMNRIGKHLRIKGTHADNLIWVAQELNKTIIHKDCLEELKEFSKCSRLNSRWMKHPKHLSWAWVAGFLDGDGHYRYRQRGNGFDIYVTFNCSETDRFIADFFKVCFSGNVFVNAKNLAIWKRNLGVQSKTFAIYFLEKMRMYSCLKYKYDTIEKILLHYKNRQAAETNQHATER